MKCTADIVQLNILSNENLVFVIEYSNLEKEKKMS